MNPQHLLEQVEAMAGVAGRPRQADLRRAVSTAYYALFHLLTQAGAARVTRTASLRPLVCRSFEHQAMKSASRMFVDGKLNPVLQSLLRTVPDDLAMVAKALYDLQEARHRADYDTRGEMNFTRQDVSEYVRRTREAFDAWERVRTDPAAEIYLLAMLFPRLGR